MTDVLTREPDNVTGGQPLIRCCSCTGQGLGVQRSRSGKHLLCDFDTFRRQRGCKCREGEGGGGGESRTLIQVDEYLWIN